MSEGSPTKGPTEGGKSPGKVPRSPGKNCLHSKAKAPTIANVRKNKKATPTITVYAFDPAFKLEMYLYTKNDHNDGFLNELKQLLEPNDEVECDYMDAMNFCYILPRRVPQSANQIAINESSEYWRQVIVRYTGGEESTAESRQEGARTLKRFFMDRAYHRYVPNDVYIVDGTNEDNPHALDEFFMDDDIKRIMETDLEESALNSEFYETYTEFARKIYSGDYASAYAHSLGFP